MSKLRPAYPKSCVTHSELKKYHLASPETFIKIHSSVSRGPRSPGHTNEGEEQQSSDFHAYVYISVIFYLKNTKFALEVPAYNRIFSFFFLIFFFLSHKHKNRSNSETHASIEQKFGKCLGQPKANISTKFRGDPTKILEVISVNKDRSVDWPRGLMHLSKLCPTTPLLGKVGTRVGI